MDSDDKTKRLEHGATKVDRIGSLPTDLIDRILQCLPTQDAARTSVLSKGWRNTWGMHPRLCLDEDFISELVSHKCSEMDEETQIIEVISRTISNIFLARSGPILDFSLWIPEDLPFHQSSDMILWIKNLSNNGVQKFELLHDSSEDCKMPSHFFSCSQLTHLCLWDCILDPPLGFEGFCNLISVHIMYVTFKADMSFGTQLEKLDMKICSGIEHLGPQFKHDNNIKELSIIDSDHIDWQWFECTQKLQVLRLRMDEEMASSVEKMINIEKLVGNMPGISSLRLEGFIFKIFKRGAFNLKRLRGAMQNLEFMYLHGIEVYDIVQLESILWLIQSSPNLQILDILLARDIVHRSDDTKLLDLTLSSDHVILHRLETLEIFDIVGSRAELRFIKLLFASSPSLKRIKLKIDTIKNDPTEGLKISQAVMQIPRASKAAKIQWH